MKKFKQALQLLGIFVISSIVVVLLLFAYLKIMYPELEIKAALNNASGLESMIGSQMMVILSILIAWKCKLIRLPECLKMSKEQWSKAALPLTLGICWMVCEWFAADFIDIEMSQKEIAQWDVISNSLIGCLFVSIIGPIAEELFMREGLLGCMLRSKVNPWVAIVLSGLVFGVMHANGYQGIPAICSGILLGILYWKTSNIVLPAIIHIINNSTSVVFDLMGDGGASNGKMYDLIGGKNAGITVCCALAIISLALLVKFLKRENAIAQ